MSVATAGRTALTGLTVTGNPILDQKEHRLLKDARKGDSQAFEKLVMPHRHRILRHAMHILRNHEDAEDVVQLAFLQALRNLDRFQGNARFSTWLLRIAINEALMMLRKYGRKYETSLDQADDSDEISIEQLAVDNRPSPEQSIVEQERRSIVRDAIIRLSPIFRTVMDLRYRQGLSLKQTSVVLGVPVSTVKSRLHHARRRLLANAQLTHLMGARSKSNKLESRHHRNR